MKILWFLAVIHTALAQPGFGSSYLRNSRLCHQWSCVNTKLGLPDSLPTSLEFGNVLRRLLPAEWHGVVDTVLQTCYHDRPRRYSSTCPGQAVMHCAVDQLIANCPESCLRKEDACAPVNSLAGANTMFTQSRYENIERNMALDRRPAWFLRNYFNSKCCNLPLLFNSTTLAECGFNSIIQYYIHNVQLERKWMSPALWRTAPISRPLSSNDSSSTQAPHTNNGLHIVSLKDVQTSTPNTQLPPIDPLDCCDISDFIQPSWRKECNFELNWAAQSRLVIKNVAPVTSTEATTTTSTSSPVRRRDVTIVPHSCEKETCVFTKLNLLSPTGAVDTEAFSKLLDNMTTTQPSWNSARARVVTTCLRKPLSDYTDQCEVNRLLACAFDVLTENCPSARKDDQCKHSSSKDGHERTCQISSSKYRPKHRREICMLPDIVDRNVLTECGLTSLGKVESVTTLVKPKTYRLFTSKYKCQDLTPSTTCLMSKMDILNKYGFLDYFKMKDRIRRFTSPSDWSTLQSVYMSSFNNGPLYIEHCNSAKKLLNVVDAMLMTCPESKRKNTAQCSNIFSQIANTPANDRNVTEEYTQQILNHFHHVFFPSMITPNVIRPRHMRKLKKTPLYHYGILNDKYAPKVTTIDVKPVVKPTEKPPLVLLPVYMRVPQSNLMIRPFENGVLRDSFTLHNQIAKAHTPINSTPVTSPSISTTSMPVSTSRGISTNPVSTTSPISTTHFVPIEHDLQFDMVRPE